MKKRLVLSLVIGTLLILATFSTALAAHTPAPEFPHSGKVEQCEFTDPSTKPVAGQVPPYGALLAVWESDCGEGAP